MAYLYGVVAVMLFALNGPIARAILEAGVTPTQNLFIRMILTSSIAGTAMLITNRSGFRLTKKQLVGTILVGVFGVASVQFAFIIAIQHLPVGIALLLQYSAVLLVALFAVVVWKEKVKRRLWIALPLTLLGLAVVGNAWSAPLDPVGVTAGLLGAVTLASYFLLGERVLTQISVVSILFWTMLFAACVWAVPSRFWEMPASQFTKLQSLGGALDSISVPVWVLLLAIVVLGTVLPYFLSFVALSRLKATSAGILAVSEIIFGSVYAWLWLGEILDPVQIVGGLVVITGIVIAQTARAGHPIDMTLAPADFTGPIPLPGVAASVTVNTESSQEAERS